MGGDQAFVMARRREHQDDVQPVLGANRGSHGGALVGTLIRGETFGSPCSSRQMTERATPLARATAA
jgi:hypothetical protein